MTSHITIRTATMSPVQAHEVATLCYQVELTSDLLDNEGALLDDLLAFGLDVLRADVLSVRVVPCGAQSQFVAQPLQKEIHA